MWDTTTNGEPINNGKFTTITISGVDNPEEVLENCKSIVTALLNHSKTKPTSDKWLTLFPEKVVKFASQLSFEDFGYDTFLFSIQSIVSDFQDPNLREWEWYSSKVNESGFQITFAGWFSFRNYWMIHYQMIPYSKFTIENNDSIFNPKVIKDVISYKNFTF